MDLDISGFRFAVGAGLFRLGDFFATDDAPAAAQPEPTPKHSTQVSSVSYDKVGSNSKSELEVDVRVRFTDPLVLLVLDPTLPTTSAVAMVTFIDKKVPVSCCVCV